jgi:hypothetical protein
MSCTKGELEAVVLAGAPTSPGGGMRKLVYSTSLSLDGCIAILRPETPAGVVPDEELHRHFKTLSER